MAEFGSGAGESIAAIAENGAASENTSIFEGAGAGVNVDPTGDVVLETLKNDDMTIRTLQATWCFPRGFVILRGIHSDVSQAFKDNVHRRIFHSPVFGYEKEVLPDFLTKTKPEFHMKLQGLHVWNGESYIALFLTRCDKNTSGPGAGAGAGNQKHGLFGGAWPNFWNSPVQCTYELEILNGEGVSLVKQGSCLKHFAQGDSFGSSFFASYSSPQLVDPKNGVDLFIRCTIKTLSRTQMKLGLFDSLSKPKMPLPRATPMPDLREDRGRDELAALKLKKPLIRIINAIGKYAEHGHHFPSKFLKLYCQGKIFEAPIRRLAVRSALFYDLYMNKQQEWLAAADSECGPIFVMDDEQPEMLDQIVKYLLVDSCPVLEHGTLGQKLELLFRAFKFGIDDLKQDLLDQILSALEPNTVLRLCLALSDLGVLADKAGDPFKILQAFVIGHRQEIRLSQEFRENPDGWRQFLLPFLV